MRSFGGWLSRERRWVNAIALVLVVAGTLWLPSFGERSRLSAYAAEGAERLAALQAQVRDVAGGRQCSDGLLEILREATPYQLTSWGTQASLGCLDTRIVANHSVYQPICGMFVDILTEQGFEVFVNGAPMEQAGAVCPAIGSATVVLTP
ncbi:hypothetical protein ABWI00_09660 [Algihabitans albus]|uniref:hypothetical protein n=1 Tax=Algihabitans albus TaxID=2164067 RepID=UPI0035D0180A